MSKSSRRFGDIVVTGRFEVGEDQRYRHVAFDMPPGVEQFHLVYDYTDRISSAPGITGGNTLDIGLFDQRGHAAGSAGFRGWSGSDRLAFTVGRDWATPPYRPGEIAPGTWFMLLGPYKVGPNGLDYRIEIRLNPGLENDLPEPGAMLPMTRATVPAAVEPGWLRGDLHCHTRYSDGDAWPAEVLAAAGEAGLDFLSITDHNGARRPVLAHGRGGLPLLIPGTETTTYGGHWNVWGVERWCEFRDPTTEGTQAAFDEALAAGAVISINHPKQLGPAWSYGDLDGNHAIEVWNGPWEAGNAEALAYWDARLRRGVRVVAVGGSDTHELGPPPARRLRRALGSPTTWVHIDGDHSAAAILAAIRRGACFVSTSPIGPQLLIDRRGEAVRVRAAGARGATVVLVSDRGSEAAHELPTDDWETEVALPSEIRYLRAEILDATGAMLALSNPIWLG